jgi:tetratricopeptide (TPR) repeat protein
VVLFLGILLLLAGALTYRALVGPPPVVGRRINDALRAGVEGKRDRAYRGLQEVLEERPLDPAAWLRTGRALLALDRPHEAGVYLRKASELDPESALIRYELAKALAAGGFTLPADRELEAVLALRPNHADGLYLRSALAASLGDVESTLHWLERALSSAASNPDGFRRDPRFDPVRNDPRFLETVLAQRLPGAFQEELSHSR